jgi:hypothetical protein
MLTQNAEELIRNLAKEIEIPVERYESAEKSYKSLADWLGRKGSRFENTGLSVYTQGSFRLGTAIRPLNGDEHYDLDIVCEFETGKATTTQRNLKTHLGHEVTAYAAAHSMDSPECWDRCWTLNYADSAQFHMDVLPSVPDGAAVRDSLVRANLVNAFAGKAIAITDRKHPKYETVSHDWPTSNPNGYADWFLERMKPIARGEMARKAFATDAEIAEIPRFRRKVPLQSAIQILKRHRDVMFAEDEEDLKPSSIILTTLATHAYQGEDTIGAALYGVLDRMDGAIERGGSLVVIRNPSDPRENFADGWRDRPEKQAAFFRWLEAVRSDFTQASQLSDVNDLVKMLAPKIGRQLIEKAAPWQRAFATDSSATRELTSAGLLQILHAPHRQTIQWPTRMTGAAFFKEATATKSAFRPRKLQTDDAPVRPGTSLQFTVETSVERPFKVYWQVVNTGSAATRARDLRGGFEEKELVLGQLTKRETAKYSGVHSVECFIVKDFVCVARTGPLVVNIS